jgi:hypothetical protein
MKFTPKTEEELASENLLPEGVYDFETIDAWDKVSKKRNEMIELKLKVYDENGGFRFVTDYLLDSVLPKLLSFAKETGTRNAYDDGEYTADTCRGTAGKVQIKIKPAGEFPARNEVKFYGEPKAKWEKAVTESAPSSYKPSAPVQDLAEDDIPFN